MEQPVLLEINGTKFDNGFVMGNFINVHKASDNLDLIKIVNAYASEEVKILSMTITEAWIAITVKDDTPVLVDGIESY